MRGVLVVLPGSIRAGYRRIPARRPSLHTRTKLRQPFLDLRGQRIVPRNLQDIAVQPERILDAPYDTKPRARMRIGET